MVDDLKTYQYQKAGYYVKEERNGYYLLVKPSRVTVFLETPTGTIAKNFKTVIRDYYKKGRVTEKLVEKFKHDACEGNVKFYLEDAGYISIK